MKILLFVLIGFLGLIVFSQIMMVRRMKQLKGQAAPDTGMKGEAGEPTLYYFFSPTCGPCRQMSPIVDKIAADHPNVFKVDVTQDGETARRFGVMGVPTTVVVDGAGTVKEVFVGVKPMSLVAGTLRAAGSGA